MRRVFFVLSLFLLVVNSGCGIGNNQTASTRTQPNTPPTGLEQLSVFRVANPDEDLQRSKNYFAKVKNVASQWKADAQLARVEINYKTISNTAGVMGSYFFVSSLDPENILKVTVTGSGDNDLQQEIINRKQQNIDDSSYQVIPLDSWKTTAGKALEVVDGQGGLSWRSSLVDQAKKAGGNLDNLHALLSLSKINDKLVWSVMYKIPDSEKKNLGQWESNTYVNSVLAENGELVSGK